MPIVAPTTKMRAASKLPGPEVVEAAPERAIKVVVAANAAVVGAGTTYEMRPPPSLMARKRGAKTTEMMAISFIMMLSAGPDVSLSGSPTVSPVTAALKICDFLVWTLPVLSTVSGSSSPMTASIAPLEMYFLALSHAPPVLDDEIAIWTDEAMAPASRPVTQRVPKQTPQRTGESMTRAPGAIISCSDASVEILMHVS